MRAARRSAEVEDPDDAGAAERAALRILGGAAQSAHALQLRLQRRGFSAAASSEAVARCCDAGYVDDAALAGSVAQRHARHGHGSARVVADLQRRGMDREVIAAAASSIAEDEASAVARVASALIERQRARGDLDDAAWRRVAAALQRRGFSNGAIRSALRALAQTG